MRTGTDLAQKQSLPLKAKINIAEHRIRQWFEHWEGDVYVSISGGKDSLALLHIVRNIYPNIVAVFCDTGLEYPEVRQQALSTPNLIVIRPKLSFKTVIEKYGFPVISKEQAEYIYEVKTTKSEKLRDIRINGNKWGKGKVSEKWKYLIDAPFNISDLCCDHLKKHPFERFERESGLKGIIGTTAAESSQRAVNWIKYGCNAFDAKRPLSRPLSVWTEIDIWEYIRLNQIEYPSVYDMGYERTGCMFCMFGVHKEKEPNRFQKMKQTHPHQWKYCINTLGLGEILDYINVRYE